MLVINIFQIPETAIPRILTGQNGTLPGVSSKASARRFFLSQNAFPEFSQHRIRNPIRIRYRRKGFLLLNLN